jgi:hypothetical protein
MVPGPVPSARVDGRSVRVALPNKGSDDGVLRSSLQAALRRPAASARPCRLALPAGRALAGQLREGLEHRRVEAGNLDEETIERLGRTLMALESRMEELKRTFGLTDEDLNLDLGPLGRLL